MAAISLESILQDLQKLQQTTGAEYAKASSDLAAIVREITPQVQHNTEAIKAAKIAEQEAKRAKQLATGAQINRAIQVLGSDVTNPVSQMAELSMALDAKQKELLELSNKRTQLSSVGALENPIQWLINQVGLAFTDEQYARVQGEISAISKLMHDRASASQQAVQTILNAHAVESEAEAAAALDRIRAESELAAIEQKLKLASSGAQALHDVYKASREEIDTKITVYRLKAQEAADRRQAALDSLRMEEARLRLDELRKDRRVQAQYDALIRRLAIDLGHDPKQVLNAPLPALEKIPGIIEALPSWLATGSVGTGPYTAYLNAMNAGGGLFAPQHRQRAKNYIEEIVSDIEAKEAKQQVGYQLPQKGPERIAAINKMLIAKNKEDWEGNQHDKVSLYQMYPVATLAKTQELKNNKLVQSAFKGLESNYRPTGKDLLEIGLTAIDNGMSVDQVARDISYLAKWHVAAVNASIGYEYLALRPLDSFRVTLPSGGIFGKKWVINSIDLTNEGQVKMALMRQKKLDRKLSGTSMPLAQPQLGLYP